MVSGNDFAKAVVTGWQMFPPHSYRVTAWMVPEPDGGYSVVGINLPGCCTQGETLEDCTAMLKEAATGLIEAYREAGEAIPWRHGHDQWMQPPTDDSQRLTVYVTVAPPNWEI